LERDVIICHPDFGHLKGFPHEKGNLGCWHWSTRNDPSDARVVAESVARIMLKRELPKGNLPTGTFLRDAHTLAIID